MSKFETIKQNLLHNFDNLSKILCIELRDDFSIIDYKSQSFIIHRIQPNDNTFVIQLNGKEVTVSNFDEEKLFKIKNAKSIGFIPIDGKQGLLRLLKLDEESHCDFVFFDQNDFCFVELKLNATSLKEKSISDNRQKAISQLKNTITLFDNKLSKNYEGLSLEAYVCTPDTYPKVNASWRELAQEFLEEMGILLFEKNEKFCK